MKHYMIVEVEVTDPNWVANYIDKVTPIVEKHGGKYLTRSPNPELLEGEGKAPQFSVLAEFPSRESALIFYHSDEYAPFKAARQAGSVGRFLLVPTEGI